MTQLTLHAKKRETLGRKVKKLRKEGILPASVYGKKLKSVSVQVLAKDFEQLFTQTGETKIISLKVEGEEKMRPVLATNPQNDPLTDGIVHIDFHQIDLKEKVTVSVPVETEGEAPAVKEKGAVLVVVADEIKVEALPQDLPEKFVVNLSNLQEFNDNILVKDLKVDQEKVKILTEENETVVMVQQPKGEIEAPPEAKVEAVPAEGEAVKAEEAETGETETEVKKEDKKKEE